MGKMQFAVSAKTARLIGRENISGVDGAIIELIKNGYDADASCVFVLFDMPFPNVPKTISYEKCNSVFGKKDIEKLLQYYTDNNKSLEKINSLSEKEELELAELLYSQNSIVIMDNGCGMNEYTLRYAWMNIGTSDKEEKRVSPKGRVKTGAKGIGRFALDKLSKSTTVFTKNDNDVLKKWEIDWEQFETASLLDEVIATIEDKNGTFIDCAKRFADGKFKVFDMYEWTSGTIIKLTPTRETWSEELFQKVNKNLSSLFPRTNKSQFDIYVSNVYYPKNSFDNEKFYLDESEYDYKIKGVFDGENNISIDIARNEIDTRKQKAIIELDDDTEKILLLKEFWARDTFQKNDYRRADYTKTIHKELDAASSTKIAPELLKSVGAFETELYFIKNTSSTIEIVKPVVKSIRKNILESFSGIKLYRDGFNVRPYGEAGGPSYDWLNLALRAQKSPAAVSHPSGSWRVRLNQIIGEVRITKEGNPNLSDMANREGLAINDEYNAFVLIIKKIIETFEADRQTVFKEYALWKDDKKKEYSKKENIINVAKENKEKREKNPSMQQESARQRDGGESEYSKADYESALLQTEKERERQERATKTMMLYSSAGVMTNTFSHEISRITTHVGSRMQHLRYALKRVIGDVYNGDPLFNPYDMIDNNENVDKLLESWLEVLMSGAQNEKFQKKRLNIVDIIENSVNTWKPLFEQKIIKVLPIKIHGERSKCVCVIAETDLLIILNNFMLNAAYFLEQNIKKERYINISITEESNRVIVELENNGPELDGIFSANPNRIFDAGVSTKKGNKENAEEIEGSGIGLWITRELVHENSGEIQVMDKSAGFGLRINLPK